MATLRQSEVAAYAARGVSLRLASRTHVGLVRSNNEDSLVLGDLASGRPSLTPGRMGPAGVLFGVCDGMGGAAAGEVASRMAASLILQHLARVEVGAEAGAFRDSLTSAVVRAGDSIRQNAAEHPSRKGMGTTCTVGAVRGGLLLVAQVGDSRAYLLRAGELRQLTTDQTWANEMLALGRVSPEQAAVMENGKAITQAVGTSDGLEVAVVALPLCHGDRILICSDGLSGMVSDEDIARVVAGAKDLELAADELVRLALEGGGRDNVTLVLCEFTGKSLALESPSEPEYQLPLKRGRKRVAGGLLVLLVLGAAFWRAEMARVATVAHVPRAEPQRAPVVVGAQKSSGPKAPVPPDHGAPQRRQVIEPGASQMGIVGSEPSSPPRAAASGPAARARAAPRRFREKAGSTEPHPKIERPRDEEEIRIIREDGPVATAPF